MHGLCSRANYGRARVCQMPCPVIFVIAPRLCGSVLPASSLHNTCMQMTMRADGLLMPGTVDACIAKLKHLSTAATISFSDIAHILDQPAVTLWTDVPASPAAKQF